METSYHDILNLLAALAIGLLVGLERGWTGRGEEEGSRIAGLRTFGLIGLLGGVSVLLGRELTVWIVPAVFLAVAGLSISAYIMGVRTAKDLGTTTVFATMLTFVLSAWAVYGYQILAVAVTVLVTALLGYKRVLHQWLTRITPEEFFSSLTLLIISVVFLPLLPDKGYGPWKALNPYWIWWMVVLISGLSFAGYIAIRLAGPRLGTLITTLAGSLASSTAVTITLAEFARRRKAKNLFIACVFIAGTIMFVRVVIEVAVVKQSLLAALWMPLTAMLVGMSLVAAWLWPRGQGAAVDVNENMALSNPLQLGTAIKFGLLLAVILVLSKALSAWLGDSGIYLLSLVSGLMDVDAITLSLARMAGEDISPEAATLGIIIASTTNTLVKGCIFAFMVGFKRYWWLVGLLGLSLSPGLILAAVML